MGDLIQVSDESGFADAPWSEDQVVEQIEFLLEKLYVHPDTEVSITFVDEATMADLHEEHMDEPGATDVMSWPMDELVAGTAQALSGPGVLGDIAICPQVAQRQAAEAGHETVCEIELLLTHGVLHLLGHDHYEPEEHKVMFALQDQLLAQWRASRRTGL